MCINVSIKINNIFNNIEPVVFEVKRSIKISLNVFNKKQTRQ